MNYKEKNIYSQLNASLIIIASSATIAGCLLSPLFSAAIIAGSIGAFVNILYLVIDHKKMEIASRYVGEANQENVFYVSARLLIGAVSGFCMLAFFWNYLTDASISGNALLVINNRDLVFARVVAAGLISGYSVSTLSRLKMHEGFKK